MNKNIKKQNNIFEQKFIIPSKKWYAVSYEKQTDEPQRIKELNIPADSAATIMIRTNANCDVEIKDSQYSFDKKDLSPNIVKYENPYYRKPVKWFDEEVFDWHGILHLQGTRIMYKDFTYVDGFKIFTYAKGKYQLNMEFIVLSDKWKGAKNIRTHLTINVV